MVRLRGHHLLCLHGFRSLGYSLPFVENMERIKKLLLDSPGEEIELLASPDDLCAKCPNLLEDTCRHEDSVRNKDMAVLDKLSVTPGSRASAVYAFEKAQRVLAPCLEELCSSCEWLQLGYCKEGLEQGLPFTSSTLPEDKDENS
jgi:hypothetical protein